MAWWSVGSATVKDSGGSEETSICKLARRAGETTSVELGEEQIDIRIGTIIYAIYWKQVELVLDDQDPAGQRGQANAGHLLCRKSSYSPETGRPPMPMLLGQR